MKENLEIEKIKAIEGVAHEHDERFSVSKDELEKANELMSNISSVSKDEIVQKDNIKTAIRTNKVYDEIWSEFVENHAEQFEKYMGYGIDTIKKIGYKKFIDFMDWRSKEDIERYRTDRIKVIPCSNCKSAFTTFQLDFGLCNKCLNDFDIARFGEVCAASDEQDPGSSAGLVIMFTYMSEFRNMYRKGFSVSKIEDAILVDDLDGMFTYCILRDYIVNSKDNSTQFLHTCERVLNQKSNSKAQERFKSLKNILDNEDDENYKLKRVKMMYNIKDE